MNKFLIFGIIVVVAVLGFAFKMNADSKAKAEALAQQIQQQKDDQAQHEIEKQRQLEENSKKESVSIAHEKNNNSSNASSVVDSGKNTLDDNNEFKLIQDTVKNRLKDPGSAQFQNQKGNCGEVNAKNGFGGYTGFSRYIYYPDNGHVIIESDSKDAIVTPELMDKIWKTTCE